MLNQLCVILLIADASALATSARVTCGIACTPSRHKGNKLPSPFMQAEELESQEEADVPLEEVEQPPLSAMARLRKEQAEERLAEKEYLDSQDPSIVQSVAVNRAIFSIVVLAVAYFISSNLSLDRLEPGIAPTQSTASAESVFSGISLPKGPTFRTGYEGAKDIGTFRPVFKPE